MPEQTSFVSFLKAVFYKSCFCIGLGTISVWAFSHPTKVTQVEPSTIQEKVNSLVSQPALVAETITRSAEPLSAPIAHASTPILKTTVLSAVEANKDAAALAISPDPNASPTVSPTPGGVAEKDKEKKSEEPKTEEPKTEEQLAQEAADAASKQAANQAPANQPLPPQVPNLPAEDTVAADKAKADKAAAEAGATAGLGGVGAGLVNTLNGSHSSGSGAYYGSGSSSSTGSKTALSSADISALSLGFKATLPDTQPGVTGQVCSVGSDGQANINCNYHNGFTVHTDRWDTTYGLSSDANFAITPAGTGSVKVNITLKFQDLDQKMQSASYSTTPTELSVHSEVRNGKQYKVYDMKLNSITALNNSRLSNIEAQLYYEMSSSGAIGALSNESRVTFSRSGVLTTGNAWELASVNRAPAANEQVIAATSIPYTMLLEKSQ